MGAAPSVFFHPAGGGRAGQRLYLYHPPAAGAPSRGTVLYIHAFAEEMNKARRMAALQSRALAAKGYAVLQPDLLGCGDSSGDFGDATWEDWIADVTEAARWLHQRHAGALWLWGLRAGALLACAAAPRLPVRSHFLFWQPAVSGRQLLQQFLRVKAAGEMLEGGSMGIVEALRRQLVAGQEVQVAGYRLHPALAAGLDTASLALAPAAAHGARVEWFELQPKAGGTLSPAAASMAETWRKAGAVLRAHVIAGPAFWQTTEIEEAPALLHATPVALDDPGPAAGVLAQPRDGLASSQPIAQ